MDRRQKKTKEAINNAFAQILRHKCCSKISVSEIIEMANVGRTTFYAHFETKEFLIKSMCDDLFEHIIDTSYNNGEKCVLYSDAVFEHLLNHIKNEETILRMISCKECSLFINCFKKRLYSLADEYILNKEQNFKYGMPRDLVLMHICNCFVEVLQWWHENKFTEDIKLVSSYIKIMYENILN